MLTKLNAAIERVTPSKLYEPRTFHHVAFVIGLSGPLCFAIALAAAVFIPPIPPSWDARHVVQYYHEHHKGIQACSALLFVTGVGFCTSAALVCDQLLRIPNVPRAVALVQLVGGHCIGIAFVMCGVILATAVYRLERPIEITQMLNDMFWFCFGLPMPCFQIQLFAISWAVLVDTRPKPYFPKYLVLANLFMILIGIPSLVMHVVYDGPLAWDGSVNFWCLMGAFGVQQVIEWGAVWRAISGAENEAGSD